VSPPPWAPTTPRTTAAPWPPDSNCREATYRCTSLREALRWWGDLPALVPSHGADGLRAMLHAAGDDAVEQRPNPEHGPDFSFVLPDDHFALMTRRKGGVAAAANAGGVVLRTYLATDKWLPSPAPWSRRVRVRGRDAILNEYRPTDGSAPLRDVTWSVPHGDGTNVIWYVADDPDRRTERELLALLESLVAA
jgi:hypothetical protein